MAERPDHPAMHLPVTVAAACRLFPGTPEHVFGGRNLTFGAAFRAAAAYWQIKARKAVVARITQAQRVRRAAERQAREAPALADLAALIDRELLSVADAMGDPAAMDRPRPRIASLQRSGRPFVSGAQNDEI